MIKKSDIPLKDKSILSRRIRDTMTGVYNDKVKGFKIFGQDKKTKDIIGKVTYNRPDRIHISDAEKRNMESRGDKFVPATMHDIVTITGQKPSERMHSIAYVGVRGEPHVVHWKGTPVESIENQEELDLLLEKVKIASTCPNCGSHDKPMFNAPEVERINRKSLKCTSCGHEDHLTKFLPSLHDKTKPRFLHGEKSLVSPEQYKKSEEKQGINLPSKFKDKTLPLYKKVGKLAKPFSDYASPMEKPSNPSGKGGKRHNVLLKALYPNEAVENEGENMSDDGVSEHDLISAALEEKPSDFVDAYKTLMQGRIEQLVADRKLQLQQALFGAPEGQEQPEQPEEPKAEEVETKDSQ